MSLLPRVTEVTSLLHHADRLLTDDEQQALDIVAEIEEPGVLLEAWMAIVYWTCRFDRYFLIRKIGKLEIK
jgi:hypothetical protein